MFIMKSIPKGLKIEKWKTKIIRRRKIVRYMTNSSFSIEIKNKSLKLYRIIRLNENFIGTFHEIIIFQR